MSELLMKCQFCKGKVKTIYRAGMFLINCPTCDCYAADSFLTLKECEDDWNNRIVDHEISFADERTGIRHKFAGLSELIMGYLTALPTTPNNINQRLVEALENIAMTAQQAALHEPEQFCSYAYGVATETLAEAQKVESAPAVVVFSVEELVQIVYRVSRTFNDFDTRTIIDALIKANALKVR